MVCAGVVGAVPFHRQIRLPDEADLDLLPYLNIRETVYCHRKPVGVRLADFLACGGLELRNAVGVRQGLLALNGRRVTDEHLVNDERAVAAQIRNGEVQAQVKRADTAPDNPGEDTGGELQLEVHTGRP